MKCAVCWICLSDSSFDALAASERESGTGLDEVFDVRRLKGITISSQRDWRQGRE